MAPKKKKPSRKNLVKKLDTIFSQYIRQRHANNGVAKCITCGKQEHWKKLQCGHFMSRKHFNTRWDEINCQVQCAGCNVFKYGEQYLFSVWLDSHIGPGTAEAMAQKSKQLNKLKDFELIELINFYKEKVAEL